MIANTTPAVRLMVSGLLRPEGTAQPLEARRGMVALDSAGDVVGLLAGILIDSNTGRPTHLVLCRDAAAGDYRLIAVEQVASLDVAVVRLRLAAADAAALPRHLPE